ncbi:hypothetical protein FLAVO9AF_480002 [Flavobacterium sp. 9AF]|uniref:RHS repeat-associated core domain-containing protein n=1 Tax=Flavobacterium sp. 9AF TaxID=2653142 RepID=UPI0012F0F378|nr:RHS repeat-associated core domain-containing protein [Flavobacterium sp. 9AF]VXC03059.1 hypothetical protein FLAVO9AF_480002 [Flavobacterium sp. 9AF]
MLRSGFFLTNNKIEYIYNAVGQKVVKTVSENSVIKTEYLSGFQYKGSMLQFFPHAEGYVNVVDNHGVNNYNYVFNYTDHLGNIRVSYGVDPDTQSIKIMEENHYYAFGLKHTNYNSDQLLYQKNANDDVVLKGGTPTIQSPYQYKYNGKEYQDELGLNFYDYGARNYDPALGRWMNMDRLVEKYVSITPYAYSLNNPIYFIDPDGNEVMGPGDEFASIDDAAKDFAVNYNSISIIENVELGALIYKNENGSFSYTIPTGHVYREKRIGKYGVPYKERVSSIYVPDFDELSKFGNVELVGIIHTHAWDRAGRKGTRHVKTDNEYSDNEYSDNDLDGTYGDGAANYGYFKNVKIASYLVTPDGQLIVTDPVGSPSSRSQVPIDKKIPSDPLSPTRKNEIYPNIFPKILPNIYDETRGGKPEDFYFIPEFNPRDDYYHK